MIHRKEAQAVIIKKMRRNMHVSSEACNSNSDKSAALPIYSMQTTKLPFGLCDDIENVNLTFLWGGIKQKKDFILSIGKKV